MTAALPSAAVAAPPAGPPPSGEIWWFLADLPGDPRTIDRASHLLDRAERERAGRFHHARDRDRFCFRRAMLRAILGRCLDRSPAELQLIPDAFGRPCLPDARDLTFSLSHSAGRVLIAVAGGIPIGIDLELIEPDRAEASVARLFMTPREFERWHALPLPDRLPQFFRLWTRKEAYVKARGVGLSYPLQDFEVAAEAGAGAALDWSREGPAESARWTLFELPAGPRHASALVADAPRPTLRRFAFNLDSSYP